MIVISMLLVLVGFVTLMLGVLNVGDDPLVFVYISIGACLAAAVFLIAGVLRSRPSRKPAVASGGDGQEASWSGAASWGGGDGETGPVERDEAPAPAGESKPHVQVVTSEDAEDDDAWTPEAEGDEDVVVVPKRSAASREEQEGAQVVTQDEAVASASPRKASKKAAGKKASKKAAGKKASKKAAGKRTSKKAAGKKASKKAATRAAGADAADVKATLSNVSGIGPAKQTQLLEHFGSAARLRAATPKEITEVEGFSETLAKRVYEALRR